MATVTDSWLFVKVTDVPGSRPETAPPMLCPVNCGPVKNRRKAKKSRGSLTSAGNPQEERKKNTSGSVNLFIRETRRFMELWNDWYIYQDISVFVNQ